MSCSGDRAVGLVALDIEEERREVSALDVGPVMAPRYRRQLLICIATVLFAIVSFAIGCMVGVRWEQENWEGVAQWRELENSTRYPAKYGRVPEKTLWFYWNTGNPPLFLQLCLETWKLHHQQDWNIELLSDGNLLEYLHPAWLPQDFPTFSLDSPANRKDCVMAAILAAYGGVAADYSIIARTSITSWWDDLVEGGYTYRGFFYRLEEPWRGLDGNAVWFLMARRDSGIFRRYSQDLRLRFGSHRGTSEDGTNYQSHPYLRTGCGTLDSIIEEVNSSLPRCREDTSLPEEERARCPQPVPGAHVPANLYLNNVKVSLSDPQSRNSGPQLPTDLLWELFDSNEKSTKVKFAALWDVYVDRKARGKNDFKMVKFFRTGGNWAKTQTSRAALLEPDGPEEGIFSALFKDAGLLL